MLADVVDFRGTVDSAVGVSHALERILTNVVGLPSECVVHIPYGVPQPHLDRESSSPTILRIGYAGRLDEDKRPDDLVAICRGLSAGRVAYSLDIAGEGSRANSVAEDLQEEIASGRVRVLGPRSRSELYERWYPKWDCFLRCSSSEGFPIAVTEAMVNGCVPVVSDFEGRSSEGVIRHMETGLVFPVGSTARAVELLTILRRDRDLLGRLSIAAAEETRGYTEDRMCEAWVKVLRETASRPLRERRPECKTTLPQGRLDRLLGVEIGESIRGIFRNHESARSSWPYANHLDDGLVREIEQRIAAIVHPAPPLDARDDGRVLS
jgi:Glycosyltransferase